MLKYFHVFEQWNKFVFLFGTLLKLQSTWVYILQFKNTILDTVCFFKFLFENNFAINRRH